MQHRAFAPLSFSSEFELVEQERVSWVLIVSAALLLGGLALGVLLGRFATSSGSSGLLIVTTATGSVLAFASMLAGPSRTVRSVATRTSALRGSKARAQAMRVSALDYPGSSRMTPGRLDPTRHYHDLFANSSETLLDALADAICGVDANGNVSFANPAAARLLGLSASALVGKRIHDVLHGMAPADCKCGSDCALHAATKCQTASSGEMNFYRADGSEFPAEYFFTPILEHGICSGHVLSFRDVSQRHAVDKMKDEFISTVSHELRTPLTSIRGALGLLSSGMLGEVDEKTANLLRIAHTNSDRLARLINDILDLERIQSEVEPIMLRPVPVFELIRQAIDCMLPMAEAAQVQLIQVGDPVEITGDPDRLLQVLTNLLSNAIKFSDAKSKVWIGTARSSAGVTLSVRDRGRGIPADKLEVIFGRFQQVDVSDSRQRGGTGLGLAICRSIVTQHAGRIWAERNPDRGSTFRVFLPYRLDALAAAAQDEVAHDRAS